jgi:glycosyltransferase involved in cell wall biosynthesis
MKALVCALHTPWPPMSGVDLRCWQILNVLRERAQVGLFALAGNASPPAEFQSAPWRVTGSAARPLDQTSWLRHKDALPSDGYYDQRSAAELRTLLDEFAPDVVVLDHLWMHSYEQVIRSRPSRLVLNAHNAESALARQLADHETHPPGRLQRRIFAARVGRLETELSNRMDQIWVSSEDDRIRFRDDLRVRAPVHVIPNAVDLARYSTPGNRPPELDGLTGPFFLFAGVFHYSPNRHAADFLIRELFPRLAQVYPEGRLLLVGANPTAAMLAAAEQDKRIVVTGRVPDAIPYLQHSSMLLTPLFEGGGTRFKIIEAFAAGLPVVSSATGVEGLGATPGEHFLLARDAGEFVNAISQLISDQRRRDTMVRSAAGFVERFSWSAARHAAGRALGELES